MKEPDRAPYNPAATISGVVLSGYESSRHGYIAWTEQEPEQEQEPDEGDVIEPV